MIEKSESKENNVNAIQTQNPDVSSFRKENKTITLIIMTI